MSMLGCISDCPAINWLLRHRCTYSDPSQYVCGCIKFENFMQSASIQPNSPPRVSVWPVSLSSSSSTSKKEGLQFCSRPLVHTYVPIVLFMPGRVLKAQYIQTRGAGG